MNQSTLDCSVVEPAPLGMTAFPYHALYFEIISPSYDCSDDLKPRGLAHFGLHPFNSDLALGLQRAADISGLTAEGRMSPWVCAQVFSSKESGTF